MLNISDGAFPKKVANSIKIPIEEAEKIFNAYHNDLFPGITKFRESYVLPTTIEHGRCHLGLGFYIKSDDPERDIRTVNNANSQFWSLLTALAINKLHQQIDLMGYENDVVVTSTVYDSIYFIVRDDPTIIKWLNDVLVPIMVTDFMTDQIVHNEANLELGTSWADLIELPNNASFVTISMTAELVRNHVKSVLVINEKYVGTYQKSLSSPYDNWPDAVAWVAEQEQLHGSN